jgi:hypothetical protein
MYIVNPEKIENKYKCHKAVAEYLMNTCNIPLLSREGIDYYFMKTSELEESLKTIPLWIHICQKLNL